ncbi:MAG: hypothetical protein OHK0013_42740 [Sandaracinaceae bacterium]
MSVHPWGDVAVDGHRVGRSPVILDLEEGPHRVEMTSASVTRARIVRVVAGQHIELEEDFMVDAGAAHVE